MSVRLRFTLAVIIGCLPDLSGGQSVRAETRIGFRQITVVEPVAIQRGTSGPVTLRSNFTLDGTHSVFFDRPGVTMVFAEKEPKAAPRKGRGSDGTPFLFNVTVEPDALPGVRELRVATAQAVSSVSHLRVTDHPVVREDEKAPNDTRETAQPVTVPVAVCGRVEKFEDVDFYRFSGKAGQSLTIEVHAQRVTAGVHGMVVRGPLIYLMDSLLTLHGPAGQIVAQNDNFFGGDSLLSVTLPEDGDYCVEVRDARYAGSGRYVYCVEIADQPYVHAVFPMAVQRGQTSPAVLIGHNLGDAAGVTVTGDGDPGWRRQRLPAAAGFTNPVEVLVSEHPQSVSDGSNTTMQTATPLELPSGVNGRLLKPDSAHFYSFAAQQGQFFLFEVESQRRGLPLDSILEIYDDSGKRLTESDDGLQTKDSRLNWKAPSEGRFIISIRDLHGRGGERFLYHLRAEPAGPDFEVHGEYYYAQLAPGTNMVWFARVNRLNGFAGPVRIDCDNLPAGVTAEPVTIPAGVDHCAIILQATPEAAISAALVTVQGRAMIPGPDGKIRETVRRGRITCEQQSSGGGQARWPVLTQIVGVTKPLDLLKVEATPAAITLKPGQTKEITVRIERQEGFTDPVTLAMSFDYFSTKLGEQLPPGVTVSKASKLRLAGKDLQGRVILECSDKAPAVERFPLSVLARVSITFSITTNYGTNPVYLTVEK